jgi:cholesterol transport system auxiliary component
MMRSNERAANILARLGARCRLMNMKRTLRTIPTTIALSLAVLVILAGCGGKVRYPTYYTLNLPAPPEPPAAENARGSVAIREFRAPAYLRQTAIVYKPSPEQIDFYAYHRWAINPCEFVTDSVIERLRASGHFARVKPYDGRPDTEYVLSGRLEKLEEIDYDGGIKVEVAISVQMTNPATGATVWTNAVSEVGDVDKRNVPAIVSEMNRTMERAISKLLSPIPASVAASATAAGRD